MMLICSTSSPLYFANNWVDVNAYLTMGRGLFHGKVLYLDLFDHKGPLLYFIYGIASLLSPHSYFGVYLLESIFFTFTLYYAFKIANLFLNKEPSYLSLFLLMPFMFITKFFCLGGSSEEFILPFIFIAIYYTISILKNNYTKKNFYIIGLCLCAIILIKFPVAIFMLPFLIAILFSTLKKQKFKKTAILVGYAFLGFFTILIPFIIYFLITHSLKAFFEVYVHFNSLYANIKLTKDYLISLGQNLISMGKSNFLEIIIILYGCFYFIFIKYFKTKIYNFSFFFSWLILFLIIYSGDSILSYYFLIFIPFIFLGLVAFMQTFDYLKFSYKIIIPLCIVLSLITTILNTNLNSNTSKIKHQNNDALSSITKDLKKEKAKKILEYYTLDIGLYNRLNIVPNIKYFYIPNIDYEIYPQAFDEQNRYLKEKLVDFVIVRAYHINSSNYFKEFENIEKNYRLYKYYDSIESYRYYLFKRK